ncbi:hypothetical protein OBCHQ24_06340 [Oceanobacillus iheyensis]|uniref:Uncharacterized protein n=1 Tax=Oceanobacillus jordanicus TaxID=2867266 RepID=A0AAW5B1S4_9BACI|nr:hypothetical protein [Oceanobacillus jordanicus]AVQ98644.1 hypothetical protein OBCHQ24_06340 [Oceanobacillus iheyensis]MCG3418411.1 hypothetical protein [Oceanobacillus jordanicus]
MTYLVSPSNHWLGYHMVEHLLELGFEVHGQENEQDSDELTLFFGRNSSYGPFNPEKKYKIAYILGDYNDKLTANTVHTYVLCKDSSKNQGKRHTCIHVPILFGEWMQMDKDGMYWNNSYVRFDSILFQKESIYIKDFIGELVDWNTKGIASREDLYVRSFRSEENPKLKLENSIYLRDNIPIEQKVEKVLQHYQENKIQYDNLYGNL